MICIDVSGVPSLANSFARDDLRRRPVFFWRQIKSLPERFIDLMRIRVVDTRYITILSMIKSCVKTDEIESCI